MKKEKEIYYIPRTPGGTDLGHLAAATEHEAWHALMQDAAHMPYAGRKAFERRGYSVNKFIETEVKK